MYDRNYKYENNENDCLKYWKPLELGDFIAGEYRGVYPYSLSADVNELWRQVAATGVLSGGKLHRSGNYLMLNYPSLAMEIIAQKVKVGDWIKITLTSFCADVQDLVFDIFVDRWRNRLFGYWDHNRRKHMIEHHQIDTPHHSSEYTQLMLF